jgi:hypothetical protein
VISWPPEIRPSVGVASFSTGSEPKSPVSRVVIAAIALRSLFRGPLVGSVNARPTAPSLNLTLAKAQTMVTRGRP